MKLGAKMPLLYPHQAVITLSLLLHVRLCARKAPGIDSYKQWLMLYGAGKGVMLICRLGKMCFRSCKEEVIPWL